MVNYSKPYYPTGADSIEVRHNLFLQNEKFHYLCHHNPVISNTSTSIFKKDEYADYYACYTSNFIKFTYKPSYNTCHGTNEKIMNNWNVHRKSLDNLNNLVT